MLMGSNVWATPSRQIWIPSPDTQPFATFNLGMDNYTTMFRKSDKGAHDLPANYGITAGFGLLPMEKLNLEAGIDLREPSDYPVLFNAKLGIPEAAWSPNMPAIAIGGYEFGTKKDVSNYNIIYGLVAKTIPALGRFSAGFYSGNGTLLVDNMGREDNEGVLLSWDRVIKEFSDRLWAGIDYQGGENKYGALSFGISWAFYEHTSAVIGYQIYNDAALMGKNTVTLQIDIDF